MNYLLSLAHLLKWLFHPAPKPSPVGVIDTFAVVAQDKRNWEGQLQMQKSSEESHPIVDTFSAPTVIETAILQNTSSSADENIPQATSAVESTVAEIEIVSELKQEFVENKEQADLPPSLPETETPLPEATRWITVQLQQQVTLANLHELQQELQQLLGQRVQLSGSQVQRVDTAALQLLVAFMHSSEVSVCWIDHSPALRQAAHLLGLSTLLNLPE